MSQEITKSNTSRTETELSSQNEDKPGEYELEDKESRNDSTNNQNRNEYPSLVAAATRIRIEKRAVCALTNAMLDDLGNERYTFIPGGIYIRRSLKNIYRV